MKQEVDIDVFTLVTTAGMGKMSGRIGEVTCFLRSRLHAKSYIFSDIHILDMERGAAQRFFGSNFVKYPDGIQGQLLQT